MISLIWAMDKNNLIGKDNELPWHYKEDLKYFRAKIKNHPVLLGDRTYESILGYRNGKKFPDSLHYVATVNDLEYDGCIMVKDINSFLSLDHEEEIFVIGGSTIYKLALPYADRLYITHINKEHDGNVYFPEFNYDDFKLISSNVVDELNFCVYERVK